MIKLDFSRSVYPIEDIPDHESVVERFSDLMSQAHVFMNPDMPKGVDADKVMRYLIYMFGPGTPVQKALPDLAQRKQYVLKKLGLLESDDKETEGYSGLCLMNEDWAIERFICFTRLSCSEDYLMMNTAELQIAAMQRGILSTSVSKAAEYKAYQEGLEKWRQTLVDARTRVMNEEISLVLQRSVTFSVRAETLGIRAEEYSRIWRDKREIFPEIIP